MPQPALVPTLIDYPDSDGCPMPEGGFQFNSLTYAVMALRVHFQYRQDVYVAGNMLLYDVEGDRQSSISPDVFVAFGVPGHTRSSYLLWEETVPAFVMEIASASTVERDRVLKRDRYAGLGIREYWQYDPLGALLTPPLQGFVLESGAYAALPSSALADGAVGVYSPVLSLHVRMVGEMLRFHDPATGRDLLTHAEEARARQDAEARLSELEARLQAMQRPSASGSQTDG